MFLYKKDRMSNKSEFENVTIRECKKKKENREKKDYF
jgi:hypothetical protein